ncbi:MAG TPA: TIGR03118 family protein [Flavipsychrobacter sp.]|nr:TIGR03118 family protein [Flavipsychrobacter sp.]
MKKTLTKLNIPLIAVVIFLLELSLVNTGCKKDTDQPQVDKNTVNSSIMKASKPIDSLAPHSYEQVTLVSDVSGFGASRTDPNLLNPWGIAIAPNGAFWIATNHSGSALIYNKKGNQVHMPVDIPLNGVAHGASPTGIVFNNTEGFIIPSVHERSRFIFVTEDGIVTAWASGDSTIKVVDRSASGTVYKGLALVNDGSESHLYATDFHNAKIDVYDEKFHLVTGITFSDPGIPTGFAPFNIQYIDGKLYVTYAKQKPDKMDDLAGPGNGYVDVYKTNGTLIKRLASKGTLNSPWGITEVSFGFGQGRDMLLIGNFGDGRINVFGEDGSFKGQLAHSGTPISIDGLWTVKEVDREGNWADEDGKVRVYFTAGPGEESHGLFGYIIIQGKDNDHDRDKLLSFFDHH